MTYNKRHKIFPILASSVIVLASCLTFSACRFTESSFAKPVVDGDGDGVPDDVTGPSPSNPITPSAESNNNNDNDDNSEDDNPDDNPDNNNSNDNNSNGNHNGGNSGGSNSGGSNSGSSNSGGSNSGSSNSGGSNSGSSNSGGSNSGSSNSGGSSNNNVQAGSEILFEGRTDCQPIILGMTPWDCGVTITNDQDTLKSGIWAIAANVSADITIFASFLALGYVIYGGYQYVFSGEEPTKAAAGKKTLSRAFIGLAITMSSAIIMGTIRAVVAGGSNLTNCINESCVGPDALLLSTFNWFIGMAGVASAIFVVYGGITYSTSAGSPDKIKKAKSMITNALIGLAIVALAELITAFVSNLIRQAKETALTPTQSITISYKRQTTAQSTSSSIQKSNHRVVSTKGTN